MKQIIIGACGCLMILFAVYVSQNFSDSAVRESELSLALSHGIHQTLESHKQTSFESEEAMEEYLVEMIRSEVNSEGDLTVKVLTSDCSRGILDVEVTECYETSDEKERKITLRKCGIIDELAA